MNQLGFGNILQSSMENLLLVEKQLREKSLSTSSPNQTQNIGQFWSEISLVSEKLSYECTKLCLCCTGYSLPTSSEISALLLGIEQTVLALVSVCYKFNPLWGNTLHQALIANTVEAVQSTRKLIRIIKDEGGSGVNDMYKQATGIIWEGCKNLQKCPHSNREAVFSQFEEQRSMVSDAFEEITETLKGDGADINDFEGDSSDGESFEPCKWSEQDKLTINPSYNVIKAAKIFYDKISPLLKEENLDSDKHNADLDQLAEDCKPITQLIDTLILELYPPVNVENMDSQTRSLGSQLLTGIKTASNSFLVTEDLQPSLEFISKAVDHNLNKMKDILRNL
ncbi:UNVERIFIED_CONTAM: hypothetical protein RMT77_005406 [Armadillidium vulgare]